MYFASGCIMRIHFITSLIAVFLLHSALSGQTSSAKKGADHGMVFATAMEVRPGILKDTIKMSDTKNYVFRGKVIALNPERTLHLCYDTELMRVAGIWHGKYINSHADKNMGPPLEGTMIVSA